MTTYDLPFASKFAAVAECLVASGLTDAEARRVVAYLSRLSMELSLKSFLEAAGMPVGEIRKCSHDLRALLAEVDKCTIEVHGADGAKIHVSASRVRSSNVGFVGYTAPMGVILSAEDHGASKYPNELRYGEMPKDFPPEALAAAAKSLTVWVAAHSTSARRG